MLRDTIPLKEKETIKVLKRFKNTNPWFGATRTRKAKFFYCFEKLKELYGIDTELIFKIPLDLKKWKSSHKSNYNSLTDVITLDGRLSVITLIHEFLHALGYDEDGAVKYSIYFFKIVFPEEFGKLKSKDKFYTR